MGEGCSSYDVHRLKALIVQAAFQMYWDACILTRLHCQFRCGRWLFGFVAFGGILCFPSWFLASASCILSIASSSLVPPATPLSIKIHA